MKCKTTDTRSSQLNYASLTTDFSYSIVSPHRSHLHLPSLSLSSIILTSLQNTKLSHHYVSLNLIIRSAHRVQHTPSTAYTKYSTVRVQHTPSTAYTSYNIHQVQHPPKFFCIPFILMITSRHLNVASASGTPPYMIDRH
jgi:hypothetical protein